MRLFQRRRSYDDETAVVWMLSRILRFLPKNKHGNVPFTPRHWGEWYEAAHDYAVICEDTEVPKWLVKIPIRSTSPNIGEALETIFEGRTDDYFVSKGGYALVHNNPEDVVLAKLVV